MTHKKQDCLERPRKTGAKWTGKDIAADEVVYGERHENYDSKRDRWDGYDPASHKAIVEEHEALEKARQKLREEEVDKGTDMKTVAKVAKAGKGKKKDDEFGSSDESDDEDDERYADGADQAGQKLDTKNVRSRFVLSNPLVLQLSYSAYRSAICVFEKIRLSTCVRPLSSPTSSFDLLIAQATSTSNPPTTIPSLDRCERRPMHQSIQRMCVDLSTWAR